MRLFRTSALLALLLLSPSVAACAEGAAADNTLVVLGPWLDVPDEQQDNDEADVFQRVLDAWGGQHGVTAEYQGTRAIGQALRAKVKDGTPPDIAIVPTVGELAGIATEDIARPVTSLVENGRPPGVGPVVVDHRGLWRGDQAYAVAIKTDLKSLLVFNPADHPAAPARLQDVPSVVPKKDWCLGLSDGSNPAWPGTDWVEDLLLHKAGQEPKKTEPGRDEPGQYTYERWASGELNWTSADVRTAFGQFGDHYVPDASTALFTSPLKAAGDLFARRCKLMHQSSFYGGESGGFWLLPQYENVVEVSGDFAARFTDKPAAAQLLRDLTDAWVGDWVRESGKQVFPLDPDPAAYDKNRQTVALGLKNASARCLDASDAMPPVMATAFQNAILEYVSDPKALTQIMNRLESVRNAIPADQRLRVVCSR